MNYLALVQAKRLFQSSINEVNRFIDDLEQVYLADRPRTYNCAKLHQIRISLMPLIINNVDFDLAKEIVADKLNISVKSISEVIDSEYYCHISRMQHHKIYCCHKLKEVGITHKKIAEVLNISSATVTRYLTIPCKLE